MIFGFAAFGVAAASLIIAGREWVERKGASASATCMPVRSPGVPRKAKISAVIVTCGLALVAAQEGGSPLWLGVALSLMAHYPLTQAFDGRLDRADAPTAGAGGPRPDVGTRPYYREATMRLALMMVTVALSSVALLQTP